MSERKREIQIPKEIFELLNRADSTERLKEKLPSLYKPSSITNPEGDEQFLWEGMGQKLMKQSRFFEAVEIFSSLYEHMLEAQIESNSWTHKGMPLVWISDSFLRLGYPIHCKRYLMLTLVEDAIREKGKISWTSGVYNRLVWRGLPEKELNDYANQVFKIYEKDFPNSLYPEWILQELNQDWITSSPSAEEAYYFKINKPYLNLLSRNIGEGTGQYLEKLAEYLLSSMAGCRTSKRKDTHSSDLDVIGSLEGLDMDFRSELGRYFIAECKDWSKPADFTTISKFCRVLDSIKAKFGILFSKNGISGNEKFKYAERELIKVYQDRGIIIIVIDANDIDNIIAGQNFINLLRKKYDKLRLDLR